MITMSNTPKNVISSDRYIPVFRPSFTRPLLLFLQSTLMWFHTEIESFWFLFTSFTYCDKFWSYNWSKTKVLGLNSRPALGDLRVSGQLLIKPFNDFYSIEDIATKFKSKTNVSNTQKIQVILLTLRSCQRENIREASYLEMINSIS